MAFAKFFYDEQLRSYILQFMAVFSGLQAQIGKNDRGDKELISVPVQYGHKDRVVASIIGKNTQTSPLRLPVMSAFIRNLALAPQDRHGVATIRRTRHLPRGGLVPDDMEVHYEYMPVPYRMQMELAIYASNTDQMFQIVEQILPLFDPTLELQPSQEELDRTRITTMELTDINSEDNYPVGTDRRIKVMTIGFDVRIHLGIPRVERDNFVRDVYLRIGAVNNDVYTSDEAIASMDADGYSYDKVFSLDDLDLFGESSESEGD